MKKLLMALLLFPMMAIAQDGKTGLPFNGLITDLNGMPAKKAHVYVHDHNAYASTDKQGRFGLTDVKPDDTLKVRYNGKTYFVPVNGKKSMKLRLIDQQSFEAEEDQQLVNYGFYYVKNRERTSSTSSISGEELVKTGRADLLDALCGKIPGMTYNIIEGRTTISIRGAAVSTLNTEHNTEPIYVVDGVVVETLSGLTVHIVDHVDVLKDANMYGAQGANGAIVVYTKTGLNH